MKLVLVFMAIVVVVILVMYAARAAGLFEDENDFPSKP